MVVNAFFFCVLISRRGAPAFGLRLLRREILFCAEVNAGYFSTLFVLENIDLFSRNCVENQIGNAIAGHITFV